jgi:hypothetical protein
LFLTLLTLLAIWDSGGPLRDRRKVAMGYEAGVNRSTKPGLKYVSTQDRDKGVVTLGGDVATDGDKLQPESTAKSIATGQAVADEIAVILLVSKETRRQ